MKIEPLRKNTLIVHFVNKESLIQSVLNSISIVRMYVLDLIGTSSKKMRQFSVELLYRRLILAFNEGMK